MNRYFAPHYVLAVLSLASLMQATAFSVGRNPDSTTTCGKIFGYSSTTQLDASSQGSTEHDSNTCARRDVIRGICATASALACGAASGQPAHATYSAYSRREDDWKQREESGEIKYSSAMELRMQLREIAPMNSEGSKIFCPNGPSAAVSPLMENKCGDRMALPSVYGRTEDALGNSVPGFGSTSPQSLRAELEAQSYFRN